MGSTLFLSLLDEYLRLATNWSQTSDEKVEQVRLTLVQLIRPMRRDIGPLYYERFFRRHSAWDALMTPLNVNALGGIDVSVIRLLRDRLIEVLGDYENTSTIPSIFELTSPAFWMVWIAGFLRRYLLNPIWRLLVVVFRSRIVRFVSLLASLASITGLVLYLWDR